MTFSLIKLENFQSHVGSVLELCPGVNVIIGPSDSGKTAIIRALRWLATNRPGGESFRSSWGGDTIVAVDIDDQRVKRVREDKYNAYVVTDPSGAKEYVAFGADTPEDVVALLNLDPINLQMQLDRPFLLDSSPGQVAQYLNEVASLDVIDKALQKLGKWTREVEANIRTYTFNQEKYEGALSTFDYLPQMEEDVAGLEKQEKKLKTLKNEYDRTAIHLMNVRKVDLELSELSDLRELGPFVTTALEHEGKLKQLEAKQTTLAATLKRLYEAEEGLDEIGPLQELRPHVEKALILEKDLAEARRSEESLARLLDKVHEYEAGIEEVHRKRHEMQEEFEEGIGEQCPLCGAKQ